VSIIRQCTTATATHCLIEDPDHPPFCYQILKQWLSIQPPPLAIPSPAAPRQLSSISLVALDRLVQLLRAKHSGRMTSTPHDFAPTPASGSALGSTPCRTPNATQ